MTGYFSLCTLCCMRSPVISILLMLSSAGNPGQLAAATDAVSMLSDARLQSAMNSEFLFQSGHFNAAFDYYRNRPLSELNAEELWRSRQMAEVLGDTQWFRQAGDALAQRDGTDPESLAQRFEASVRQGRSQAAAGQWRALIRGGPDGAGWLLARASIVALLPDFGRQLQDSLTAFAAMPDLSEQERFELFIFAAQWQMADVAHGLQAGLAKDSSQASMAALISRCLAAQSESCVRSLRQLEPDGLDETQRRGVLSIAQGNGDAVQVQRWLASLQQDGATFYQRIVGLGNAPEQARIEQLKREIADNSGLSDFQRAALLGSLAESANDWPAAESHYTEALAAGKPGSVALRLPVVLMRQNRREQAYAMLRTVQDNPAYSDEIRREAFRIEIRFNRVLHDDGAQQDPVYLRALAYWPDAHDLRYDYAMHLMNQDRIEQSISQLQGIIRQAPASANALNAYGYSLAKDLNRPRDALKPVQRAYQLAPGQAEIVDSYGYVLHRLGRNREALPFLRQAMDLAPSAETAGHLAKVYLELGQTAHAREALSTGLELDAGDAVLLAMQERLR